MEIQQREDTKWIYRSLVVNHLIIKIKNHQLGYLKKSSYVDRRSKELFSDEPFDLGVEQMKIQNTENNTSNIITWYYKYSI